MSGTADLVFAGGPVYTADASGRRMMAATADDGRPATAIAVSGGRITAIGDAAGSRIRDLTGPRTEVISLRGRALLPGFQDAHVHPVFAGATMTACNLIGARSRDEALARISAYALAHPEKEWIAGGGWRMEWFPGGTPDRRTLDAVTGGRPACLLNRDCHGAWASSRALQLAGLDARTPDPADGRIEREADGSPQGTLHEGAASLVAGIVPPPDLGEQVAGLLLAQRHLQARGITAWQDAIVGEYLGSQDPLPAYLAAASGKLTARVAGALWWDRARGAGQLADLLTRRERGQAGRFRANTVKIMQDGVAENFTAAVLDPYLDPAGCHSRGSGLSYIDPQALRDYVTRLDGEHFQVHLHAIGDRAVRESLDAIEAARAANGPGDGRHHIAHLQLIHPDDLPRFAALGVTATIQGLWAAHEPQMDQLTIPFVGPERAARHYLFGDLLRSGARLAAGSDWAVSSANPLRAIHVAVNRALPGAAGPEAEPFLPGQRLSLAEALAAYTAGSAFVNHLDDVTGTITPGKLADLIVLDTDPFAVAAQDIASVRVLQTFVEGEQVYQEEQLMTSSSAGRAPASPVPPGAVPVRKVPLGRGGPQVSRAGLGLMGMSGIYGPADEAESIATIRAAVDAGITLLDTGDFYGMGHNELLLARALRGIDRSSVFIQVKFGGQRDPRGAFIGHDASPAGVKNSLAYTLTRLGTDYVDLYQPARLDPRVPIEETVGAITEMIEAGYVRYLGLSEMGPETIRRAHAVHPVTALQIEYSLMSRGIEAAILPVVRELGIGVTAYGILSRGLLSSASARQITEGDPRARFPRFQGDNLQRNLGLLAALERIAESKRATTAQLAIAWVLACGDDIIPLIGTKRRDRLAEALGALDISLSPADLAALEAAVPPGEVAGERYEAGQMAALDSERGSA